MLVCIVTQALTLHDTMSDEVNELIHNRQKQRKEYRRTSKKKNLLERNKLSHELKKEQYLNFEKHCRRNRELCFELSKKH